MKTTYLLCAATIVFASACNQNGPANQREDIRESKRAVIKEADILATNLAKEGRSIVQAEGSYVDCTVGWSDAGVQYDAYVQLDVVDIRPPDQVRAFADRLEQAGWDDVEYVEENNAANAKSDGVYLVVQPSDPQANAVGAQSLALTFMSIGCLPDPTDVAQTYSPHKRPLPLSVPVEPDKDPDTDRTPPSSYFDD